MARKTNGTTTTTRNKKPIASTQPAPVQAAPEVVQEVAHEVPQNGKSARVVAINHGQASPSYSLVSPGQANIEDQIRRRAYELYLERRATSGGDNVSGDENQDWLSAEREIRSRQNGQQHSA